MANKRHRLLHTLVFSSVLAASGCGAASPARLEPAPIAANTYMAASSIEASAPRTEAGQQAQSSPYAEQAQSEQAQSEQAQSEPTATDPRYCEAGWPTTKGSRCDDVVNDEGETETVCCGTYPLAEDATYDADNHNCCVRAS